MKALIYFKNDKMRIELLQNNIFLMILLMVRTFFFDFL